MDDLPQFKVLALDETEYWFSDLLKELARRLIGLYVVDVNRHVYAAEITPSYEAYFLCTEFTEARLDEGERNWLYDQIQEGDSSTDLVAYFHAHTIRDEQFVDEYELTPEEWQELIDEYEGDREAAWRALLGEVLEYYRGNSPDIGEWT